MTAHRFHVPEAGPGARVSLPEHAAHHAREVLRLRAGAVVRIFDGAGAEFEATLEAMFLMAAVDGVIQKEELEQLAASFQAIVDMYHVKGLELQSMLDRFNEKLALEQTPEERTAEYERRWKSGGLPKAPSRARAASCTAGWSSGVIAGWPP